MDAMIPTPLDKCKGAMVATAIGDALGWPNELRAKNDKRHSTAGDDFVLWTRRCNKPRWHSEPILPGEYSDDTQLTLSVSRSLIAGNWEEQFSQKELPFWLTYERGGGKALLKAARCYRGGGAPWLSKNSPDYFNAGGNGAVMRILPHVIAVGETADVKFLMTQVIRNSLFSHGHPRAVLGATCYAFALNYLLKKNTVLEYGELVDAVIDGSNIWGLSPDPVEFSYWFESARTNAQYKYLEVWNQTVSNMVEKLQFIKMSLKKGLILDDMKVLSELDCFGKANGAGDVAILAAIYLASKYANNPVLGIKIPAFAFGADTDTVASITGGLLGMLCGTYWIPSNWKCVQDYDCIIQITELLRSPNRKEASKSIVSEHKTDPSTWENSPIGWIKQLTVSEYEAGKGYVVSISRCQSALGQTFYRKDCHMHYYPAQPNISPETLRSHEEHSATSKSQKEFSLASSDIAKLLSDSGLKSKTFGKMLLLVQELMLSDDSSDVIAKRMRVDVKIVNTLRQYIKSKD